MHSNPLNINISFLLLLLFIPLDGNSNIFRMVHNESLLQGCDILLEKIEMEGSYKSPCAKYEKLRYCNVEPDYMNLTSWCKQLYLPEIKKFVVDTRSHYLVNNRHNRGHHSKNEHTQAQDYFSPRHWLSIESRDQMHTDIVIDARCNFKWPHIYFHTIADCQLGIIPSLFAFFRGYRKLDSEKSVTLIVDNSTKFLCETLHQPNNHNSALASDYTIDIYQRESLFMFSRFRRMIQGNTSSFRCLNLVNQDHWRHGSLPLIATDEYIWPQARKESFIFDNTVCLHEFRLLYFSEFCVNCPLTRRKYGYETDIRSTSSPRNAIGQGSYARNVILIINRPRDKPRHIVEINALVEHLRDAFPSFIIRQFYGNESLCETIAMFHSARVVIGAHGSGVVNTIFCRYNTFLLELTFSHVEAGNPGPWRTNTYKAVEVGLVCRIYLVPHKTGLTDKDLQLRLPFHLNHTDFIAIENILRSYLRDENLAQDWGLSKDRMHSSQYFYNNFLGYFLLNRSSSSI